MFFLDQSYSLNEYQKWIRFEGCVYCVELLMYTASVKLNLMGLNVFICVLLSGKGIEKYRLCSAAHCAGPVNGHIFGNVCLGQCRIFDGHANGPHLHQLFRLREGLLVVRERGFVVVLERLLEVGVVFGFKYHRVVPIIIFQKKFEVRKQKYLFLKLWCLSKFCAVKHKKLIDLNFISSRTECQTRERPSW